MTTNQTINGVPRAYADLERINIHGEQDRKNEDGQWVKTWKERQPGKTISHHSRASGLWNKISARCLAGGKYQLGNPAYVGTTNGFDDFQQFAEWCNEQPGYSSFDAEGFRFEIDKDILVPGNKVYSPDTCCFVPKSVNMFWTRCASKDGGLIGVSFVKSRGNYVAQCSNGGHRKALGVFSSAIDAHKAWIRAKGQALDDLLNPLSLDERIVKGMYDKLRAFEIAADELTKGPRP